MIFYYYISSQTKSQFTLVFRVMLLSRAFDRVVIMNGELQKIARKLVNSTSELFRYRNDSFQSDIFSSDIGITDVNVRCQLSRTLRSMLMPT
jgi:hypothetical protein